MTTAKKLRKLADIIRNVPDKEWDFRYFFDGDRECGCAMHHANKMFPGKVFMTRVDVRDALCISDDESYRLFIEGSFKNIPQGDIADRIEQLALDYETRD